MRRINLMTLAFVLLLVSTFPLNYSMINNSNTLFMIGVALVIISVILFSGVLNSFLIKKGYNYKTHPDFNIYYDNRLKRNYWILGYFGGGAICIADAELLAREYAKNNKVPYKTVVIDEIFKSRRFKGFKYMYSTTKQNPDVDAEIFDDVFKWLTD